MSVGVGVGLGVEGGKSGGVEEDEGEEGCGAMGEEGEGKGGSSVEMDRCEPTEGSNGSLAPSLSSPSWTWEEEEGKGEGECRGEDQVPALFRESQSPVADSFR